MSALNISQNGACACDKTALDGSLWQGASGPSRARPVQRSGYYWLSHRSALFPLSLAVQGTTALRLLGFPLPRPYSQSEPSYFLAVNTYRLLLLPVPLLTRIGWLAIQVLNREKVTPIWS